MKVNRNGQSETVEVTADGEGFCSQAGALLLTNLADRLGLTEALTEALAPTRRRRSAHADGEVLRDLIVTLIQGGEHLSDLAALRDQPDLFGEVASDSTAFRALERIGPAELEGDQGSPQGGAGAGLCARCRPRAPDPRRRRRASGSPLREGGRGRQLTREVSASIRCSATWRDQKVRSTASCGPATQAPTPEPTRWRRSKRHCSSCRPPRWTGRSSCAATRPPACTR